MLIIYGLLLLLFGLYSYALVDPNFTLFDHSLWAGFRDTMVPLGYYQRPWSLGIYLVFVVLLTGFSLYWSGRKTNALKLAGLIGLCLLMSYPFLSHDFFNYLFDAKILTVYHQNPYLHKALDFPLDPWLRFMHWTHRTYPYGLSFLLITLVPSFFAFGKLVLNFLLFKLMFTGFYLAGTYFLSKLNRRAGVLFATSPLIIVEGLVNSHNDLLGAVLMIMAVYFWKQKKKLPSAVTGLLSIGIKYLTVIFLPLFTKLKYKELVAFALYLLALIYAYTRLGIHPWYFLNLSVFLPFYRGSLKPVVILNAGLLLSYYPYILYGGWDEAWKVSVKEAVIGVTLLLFLLSLWFEFRQNFRHKAALRHHHD